MTENTIRFRKKREFGEIIIDSFLFLKQEHRPILKLIVLYVLPFVILHAVVTVYFQKNILFKIDFSDPETLMSNIRPVYLNVFLFSLFGIFVQAMLIGTYYSYIETYIKKGPGNFDFNEVTDQLFSNGLLALKAAAFWFAAVFVGLILCFVPGIYFATSLSLVFIISLFEKEKLGNAVVRSTLLVNTQWWNTFMLNVFGVVVVWLIGILLTIPLSFSASSEVIGTSINELEGQQMTEWYWYVSGFSTAVSSLLWMIPYTFLAFQYFNLKERSSGSQRQVFGE